MFDNPQFWENVFRAIMISIGGTITGLIIAAIKKLFKNQKMERIENEQKIKILCTSNKNLLRKEIVGMYEDALEKEYITNLKLATAEELYKSYKELEGNSFVDDVMVKLRKMNVKAINIKGL